MSLPDVSITTVLFNSSATVERFAEPLKEAVTAGSVEVIAVDNASPDDSAARLKAALPGARILTAPRNLGFAGGCNLAWPRARGRYCLLLNPDVEASADGIRDLVQWMDAHPDVAVASPLLEDENGVASTGVARAFPSLGWTLGEMLRVHKLMSARMRSERLMGAYWNGQPEQVDWVPFAAAMVRREAIDSVGELSEELFMYGEDLEWCWRLRQAGWLVAVTGEATFVHTGGMSSMATWGEVGSSERIIEGSAVALRLMHGPVWTRLYAGAAALALLLEGFDPRRDAGQRAMNRLHARHWLHQTVRRHPERAPESRLEPRVPPA